MGMMAKRPRVPLTNPYLVSLAKQGRLCPLCGAPTRLNGLELSQDGAMEVCDNPACTYFMATPAPEWAMGKRCEPYTDMPKFRGAAKPRFKVIEGGMG